MNNHYDVEDLSCELQIKMAYLDLIHNRFVSSNCDQFGGIHLNKIEVDAFGWMISTTGTVIYQINDALYGPGAKSKHPTTQAQATLTVTEDPPRPATPQVMNLAAFNSFLNIMDRELDDFSQNWDDDPRTVTRRFNDLMTLVKGAKLGLNNEAMD